jgi:hypothetical protein
VTASGLVFIGATNFDKKFRAHDKLTGTLLCESCPRRFRISRGAMAHRERRSVSNSFRKGNQ